MVWLGKDDLNPQFGRLSRHQNRSPSCLPAWQIALEKAQSLALQNIQQWNASRTSCDWADLPRGCNPSSGGLSVVRAWRKRRQIGNLLGPIEWLLSMRANSVCRLVNNIRVVEFCAGSGHVGLAIAALLGDSPSLHGCELDVKLIEINDKKIDTIFQRLAQAGSVVRGRCEVRKQPLEAYDEPFDLGIALHGCGAATDAVLDQCLQARAAFVLVPCCVGRLAQPEHFPSRPRSTRIAELLIPTEMRSISRSGDCTVRNPTNFAPQDLLRRECKKVVDADRLAFAEEAGYFTARFTMSPFGCTPKNDVLLGWPCEWLAADFENLDSPYTIEH